MKATRANLSKAATGALLVMVALACMLTHAAAQTVSAGANTNWWTNTPPVPTNAPTDLPRRTNFPPRFTNNLAVWKTQAPGGTNPPLVWTNQPPIWTNQPSSGTNPPPVFTNQPPVSTNVPPAYTNTPPVVSTNHLPRGLPGNVQAVTRQFQAERNQLIAQLQSSTDATQRAAILGQLELLREQLQQQLQAIFQDARNQAQQMQQHFANPMRSDGGGSGGGSSGTGPGGGRPRP
jgi:hypothetical protein